MRSRRDDLSTVRWRPPHRHRTSRPDLLDVIKLGGSVGDLGEPDLDTLVVHKLIDNTSIKKYGVFILAERPEEE